jgi:hypothetical protein
MLTALGLMTLCCAAPILLIGGGGAAISGFFGDNLWLIVGGVAVLALGILLLKGRSAE